MTGTRHSRREILQATAALAAAASFGATVGRAAAQPHAQIDAVLRRATEAKEVPGVVAVAATDKGIFFEGAFGTRGSRHGPRDDARYDFPTRLDDQGGHLGRGYAARRAG